MPPRYPKLTAMLAIALLIIGVAWPFSAPVEAKGKKGKSASRSKSSKRSSTKSKKRRSKNVAEDQLAAIPANYPIAPDRIEVIENGEASSPDLSRHLNPPLPRSQSPQTPSDPDLGASKRRKNVKIDESRALQIQEALKQRGYYNGELTGVYDSDTIEAMRRFQVNQKINATGYPTAHALKRLGLTNW
ncbi:MAG: peptidoglycan-binding protein [Acidobacteria bacterium]|nr:peptidoglycan-binding protein [Acidobacteriota bacterium]